MVDFLAHDSFFLDFVVVHAVEVTVAVVAEHPESFVEVAVACEVVAFVVGSFACQLGLLPSS